MSSRDHENGFVGAMESFHGLCTRKQLHGFAIPAIRSWLPWCKAQRGQAEYDRLAALLSLAALALTLRNLTIRIPARHPAPLLLVGAVGGFRGANMDHGGLVRVDTLPAVEMIKQTYRRRRRRQQHGIDLIVLEYAEKPIDVF